VFETAPGAPQQKRTEISSHLKDRIVATKIQALSAKAGERPPTTTASSSQLANENATAASNAEIKLPNDLVTSLLKATEEQSALIEGQRKEHANQIEILTKTFTQQIEALKAEVTVIKDARNTERIRIACRDEAELQRVKEANRRRWHPSAAWPTLPSEGGQCQPNSRP
jgi:hypothetical protein